MGWGGATLNSCVCSKTFIGCATRLRKTLIRPFGATQNTYSTVFFLQNTHSVVFCLLTGSKHLLETLRAFEKNLCAHLARRKKLILSFYPSQELSIASPVCEAILLPAMVTARPARDENMSDDHINRSNAAPRRKNAF